MTTLEDAIKSNDIAKWIAVSRILHCYVVRDYWLSPAHYNPERAQTFENYAKALELLL